MKEDDCPSWQISLVEFKGLVQQGLYCEIADSHAKLSKTKKKHDKTAHGTEICLFFFGRLKIRLSSIYYHAKITAQESPLKMLGIKIIDKAKRRASSNSTRKKQIGKNVKSITINSTSKYFGLDTQNHQILRFRGILDLN